MKFIFYVALLWFCVALLANCATCPTEPVATIQPFFPVSGMVVKGFDEDCDGDLDYWQHYLNGNETGRRIYINE